jgi:hypothetical protein
MTTRTKDTSVPLSCTAALYDSILISTAANYPPALCVITDALYTNNNDVAGNGGGSSGGFKVPTIPSSRALRRTASVAAQAARMSRAKSSGRIYMPPPASAVGSGSGSGAGGSNAAMSRSNSASSTVDGTVLSTTTTMTTTATTKKLTPGRRGEKRKRPTEQQVAQDDERRRRAGKITTMVVGNSSLIFDTGAAAATSDSTSRPFLEASGHADIAAPTDDDPFGHSGRIEESITSMIRPASASASASASSSSLRPHTTQVCESKNKASIKKRLLACLEARQCGRDHPEFKDVFSIANRGVCFALVSIPGDS